MGAGWSKSNSCWLQTDKQVYHDGEYVQGLVCLNIVKPLTVTSIDCQLEGVEKTHWTEQRTSNDNTTTVTYGGKLPLLNVVQQLGGAGRELAPGQYQWQVVFGLPVGLPSSYKICAGGDRAEVLYTVSVAFHTPGILTRAIRSTHVLTVRQRMQSPPTIVDQSAELPLVACCCINQGVVSAHIRLDRDKAQPGETVQVILEVDNRSRLPMDGIQLSLKREVLMRERPASRGSTHRMQAELAKTQHPGIQPFTTLQGSMARKLALQLPPDLPPSMHGALITCDYFVKAKMKVGSFVKDMRLKVPLVVLAPQPQPTEEAPFYSEPPPFWCPGEVQPPVGIEVPSAPPLPADLLRPDASFWQRANSHGRGGLPEPLLGGGGGGPAFGYPAV